MIIRGTTSPFSTLKLLLWTNRALQGVNIWRNSGRLPLWPLLPLATQSNAIAPVYSGQSYFCTIPGAIRSCEMCQIQPVGNDDCSFCPEEYILRTHFFLFKPWVSTICKIISWRDFWTNNLLWGKKDLIATERREPDCSLGVSELG